MNEYSLLLYPYFFSKHEADQRVENAVVGGAPAEPIRITLGGVGISGASCAFEIQGTSIYYIDIVTGVG